MLVGLVVLAVGLVIFAGDVVVGRADLFLLSAAVLGLGHGLAYLGSQELTDRVAPPDRRAQIFSAFQIGLYFGATVPALIVGFVAGRSGLTAATLGFAAVVALLTIAGLAWIVNSRSAAVQG